MLKRIMTGLIGFALSIYVLNHGGWILTCAMFICAMVCLNELYSALSGKFIYVHMLGYLLSSAYIFILLNKFSLIKLMILLSIFILALLIFLVFMHKRANIIDCMITFFGVFYITFLLSFVILVRRQTHGEFFVWLIFISAWGCDTCAYFAGKFFGRHKLITSLSPKKTIEGTLGGSFGVLIISFIYTYMFSLGAKYALMCFVASIFAQLGDLSASAIKRYKNIKNYGDILPGHGGLIDRFDSVLFTAPIIYLALYISKIFNL